MSRPVRETLRRQLHRTQYPSRYLWDLVYGSHRAAGSSLGMQSPRRHGLLFFVTTIVDGLVACLLC